tara:strand:+ start:217 stop:975 length:759 start_codon:yes stop_codon:yes gene_type:complete
MGAFTVEVKPTIGAIQQHAGVYTVGDLLFDWTEFEIPRGGAKLVGATAITRPKGDTNPPTPNPFGIHLLFGKVGTSLGTSNAVPYSAKPTEDILGAVKIETTDYIQSAGTQLTSVAHVSAKDVNLQPNTETPVKGVSVGFDKYYVAGVAAGAFFFTTATNIIASDGAASTTLICDGADADLQEHFLPGDTIQIGTTVSGVAAGTTLGDVLTVDSATQITLTETSKALLKDGMLLYNTKPVKILLHFEKAGRN